MAWMLRGLDAPARHPDVVLTVTLGAIFGLLIVPVPPGLLDVLLAANIAASTLILVAVLLADRPLALSTFPSLLLVTTLARLALNVSSTRLILGLGRAGSLVEAFGRFVVAGDVVLGLVVFAILVLVQLLVIGKGAERVAEVGARFTLDALPGRQMSIDAALRSGALSEEQADLQRRDLQRESQFHGAMDGAMKFVKGDAIAGLVIIALNLGAGLGLGVLRHGLTVVEAIERYAILTVGDGLVAQIPALLVTLSAGVLTTRVGGDRASTDLGRSLGRELFGRPKAMRLAAAFCGGLALIPGLPTLPFVVVGVALGAASTLGPGAREPAERRAGLERRLRVAEASPPVPDPPSVVAPLGVDLDPELSSALGLDAGREARSELVRELLPQLRNAIFLETGVRLPGVRVRAGAPGLPTRSVVVRVNEVPVAAAEVDLDRLLVLEPPEALEARRIPARPARHPVHGGRASTVELAAEAEVVSAGAVAWGPAGVVALHVARAAREHLRRFVGLQETHEMLERVRAAYPALVQEVVPAAVTLGQLADVLRQLVDEQVSIRDLKTILEALGASAGDEPSTDALTERARAALALQIIAEHTGPGGRLEAVILAPALEAHLWSARGASGELALAPPAAEAVVTSAAATLRARAEGGGRPVLIVPAELRRSLRRLLAPALPELAVLSVAELPPRLLVEPVAEIGLTEQDLGALPDPSPHSEVAL